MRIAYFVHGRGRGHSVRSESVVNHLAASVPDAKIAVFGPDRERNRFRVADPFRTIRSVPRGIKTVPAMVRLALNYRQTLDDERCDLVVSDGDPASLLAAKLLGLPSVAVGHNVIFTRASLPPGVPRSALWYERANAWLSTKPATAAVAANFLPLSPSDGRTRVARPDTRWESWPEVSDDGFYLAYFRDGDDGGLVELLASRGRQVKVYGEFEGVLPETAQKRPFDNDGFLADLARCRAVVATGGSNLITEALYLKKPIFGIFKAMDMEQRINIALLQDRGLGDGCHIDSVSPERVVEFVERVEEHRFEVINITEQMPTVSEAVLATVHTLLKA